MIASEVKDNIRIRKQRIRVKWMGAKRAGRNGGTNKNTSRANPTKT